MKIFLSHSSRDKALVREIRSYLPDHISTWLDEKELLIGAPLGVTIRNAIQKEADFVAIFLGHEAINSEWVQQELQWALDREKDIGRTFVLPILLEDIWSQVQPKEFQKRKYMKCFDQSETAVRYVADQLSKHIFAWLSQHLDESKKQELEERKKGIKAKGEFMLLFFAPDESTKRMEIAYRRVYSKSKSENRDNIIKQLSDSVKDEIATIRQQSDHVYKKDSPFNEAVIGRMENILSAFIKKTEKEKIKNPFDIYLRLLEDWEVDTLKLIKATKNLADSL